MMKSILLTAMILGTPLAMAQTMGPHNGNLCPDPGPVFTKPTPACGAATLHAGLFKPGRFQLVYQSTAGGCIPREVFLGCQ